MTETNRIYVYLFDKLDSLEENFVSENISRLPGFRREQCLKYQKESDKKACILAYRLLEKGLAERYGTVNPISFVYNENGKPYLREYPDIFFSISHSESSVICALADFEIGADIESIRPYDMKMAELICGDDELEQLSVSDAPERLFCRFWTEKESYAKAKGDGVAHALKHNMGELGFLYIDAADYLITIYHGKSDIPILCLGTV